MALLRSRMLAVAVVAASMAACSGSDATDPDRAQETPEPRATTDTPIDSEPTASAVATVIGDLVSAIGRVDVSPTGNRVVDGYGSFGAAEALSQQLGDGRFARWIVPSGPESWSVVLDDGSGVDVIVSNDGLELTPTSQPGTFTPDAAPALVGADGEPLQASVGRSLFDDPLPDTRVVTDGDRLVALTEPTDRYAHGVLGDDLEASAISSIGADGDSVSIVALDAPDVFEAISPMLADIDGDGDLEAVATVSNSDVGARISAYDLDGELVAETPAIGLGNRWRNLLAVAPIGPNGQVELIDVQTPHIGGILQFFRFDGSTTLELVASTESFSTHSIGSRNLDQGIVTDADGDGRLDVLIPSQDQRELAVVTRDDSTESGLRETMRIDLGGRLTTNVAASAADSRVSYAVGTDDGRILVWPRSG